MSREDYFYSQDSPHYSYEMMYQNDTPFSKYKDSSVSKSNSMRFLGISSTNPLSEEGPTIANYEKEYKNGDICIYNNIDYIYDGSNWQKLGNDGKSAYELAVEAGFMGSEAEWLESLTGPVGPQGESAYEIAKEKGFVGSEEDWLESLKGINGLAGQNGKSAYEIAVDNGFLGTEEQWLTSLKGADGATGQDGKDGANGEDGANGLSAYEVAVSHGYSGTEVEWLESLKGANGQQGVAGQDGKDWIPTEQELNGIADRVISRLPDADNESY